MDEARLIVLEPLEAAYTCCYSPASLLLCVMPPGAEPLWLGKLPCLLFAPLLDVA
jgi:hypothetical protein